MHDSVAQVRRHLADIPELITEAQHYLTPGTAPKDPDNRHGAQIYRIPIVAEIADLLDEREKDVEELGFNRMAGERRLGVLPTLGLWVSLVYPELQDLNMDQNLRMCCQPRQHTITGECDWLSEYAEPIIELHPDFPRDIEQLWNELRKACRIRHQYTPKCPNCGHRIEGVYGNAEDLAPAWWRCLGCGRTWIHDAEVQRLALTQPRMTLRQIASWLNIPLRTLHNWRAQGRFQGDSRGLYEVAHVEAAAKKAKRVTA